MNENDIMGIVDSKLDAQLFTDAINDLRRRDVSSCFLLSPSPKSACWGSLCTDNHYWMILI